MPQTKSQLIDEAKKLGLKIEPSMKMADIRQLITDSTDKKPEGLVEESQVKSGEIAKAGKRSAKAKRQAEEESIRKEKAHQDAKITRPKSNQKPPRSKLERRSKGYRKSAEKLETNKSYDLNQAIELAKTTSSVKFDASVELHVNLSVDPRQADQNIRDNVLLPAGSGKKVRIAALSEDPKSALESGADMAGGDDLIEQIDKGKIDFDILIATPSFMPKLGKYAKVLGPKGLMPNPKSGTVTNDVQKAVSEAKAGRVEYRVDSTGIVHLAIGKVSFSEDSLKQNILAVITSIRANKPSSVKSNYLKSVYLASAMGPSINVDPVSLNEP